MATLPTVTLWKGEKHLICNADDTERFVADGWAPPAPPEPPKQDPPPPADPEPAAPRKGRK